MADAWWLHPHMDSVDLGKDQLISFVSRTPSKWEAVAVVPGWGGSGPAGACRWVICPGPE